MIYWLLSPRFFEEVGLCESWRRRERRSLNTRGDEQNGNRWDPRPVSLLAVLVSLPRKGSLKDLWTLSGGGGWVLNISPFYCWNSRILSNQRNPASPDKSLSGENQKPGDLGSDQLWEEGPSLRPIFSLYKTGKSEESNLLWPHSLRGWGTPSEMMNEKLRLTN